MNHLAEIRIDRASETDVPLILQFVRDLAAYEKLSDQVSVDESMLREALFSSNPRAHAVIAYRDQSPLGFAIYYFNYSSFSGLPGLYLEDVFVRSEARGTGVGRTLFQWLAREAVVQGCGRMEWAVLNWNQPAFDFYTSLAAKAVDDWTVFRLDSAQLSDLAKRDPA